GTSATASAAPRRWGWRRPMAPSATTSATREWPRVSLSCSCSGPAAGGAGLTVGPDLPLSMVPRVFPAFPGRDEVAVYATLRPARELGGDFYDFYFVDDSRLFFCVGDVSDKGVPAARFMAVTKTLIKTRNAEEASTAKLASYLNAELARDNDKCMFVTLFLARLNLTTGELVYTNA